MSKPLDGHMVWERALAGSRWLVEHQNPEGSWRGLKDPSVDAYYKVSWSLTETGQLAAAHRTLTYAQKHFFTAEGDFLPRKNPWHTNVHYPYANAHFIIGSMFAKRYEIAMPAFSFLLTQQSPDHGGFYSRLTRQGEKNSADTMSSSAAGIACLASGNITAAKRAADYLSHIITLQLDPRAFFFTTTKADGRLYTETPDDHEIFPRVVDITREDQCWYALGLPLSFLVLLAGATHETRHLDLARWYFDFQQRCTNPWDGWSSGKAGWGCAMLYRITGETSYRNIALHIAENIITKQESDGGWLSGQSRPPDICNADIDLTADFTLWLSLISANLLTRDAEKIPVVFSRIRIPENRHGRTFKQTVQNTIKAHYRILREEGLKKYLYCSYNYRKGQVLSMIKRGRKHNTHR